MSKQTISTITDAVMEGMAEWQARPLDRVYPVVFIDCIYVKIREGQVANRPIYLTRCPAESRHRGGEENLQGPYPQVRAEPGSVGRTPSTSPGSRPDPGQDVVRGGISGPWISGRHVHVVRIKPRTHWSRSRAQSAGTELVVGWPVSMIPGRFTAQPGDADLSAPWAGVSNS